jgi:hypothetical protein
VGSTGMNIPIMPSMMESVPPDIRSSFIIFS